MLAATMLAATMVAILEAIGGLFEARRHPPF